MKVTTAWNIEHDAAVVAYDYRHGHAVPVDQINAVLSLFYNQDMYPWLYVWWDTGACVVEEKGLLVTATLDLTTEEVDAVCTAITETAEHVKQFDEWEVRTDDVFA